MILLAALKLLLARLSGENDIVIGSTVAGRNRPELDGLVGFFINALALRSDLSGNPRFVELLRRVREVCLEAYTHQDTPFELVVEELGPERDPRRHPVFKCFSTWRRSPTASCACPVARLLGSTATSSARSSIWWRAPARSTARSSLR